VWMYCLKIVKIDYSQHEIVQSTIVSGVVTLCTPTYFNVCTSKPVSHTVCALGADVTHDQCD
jgi:hypothetical protein